ncbi:MULTISPECIES: hypothetical protein [Alphaproteobacteria]|uniref:hypothetical protein n=1 Tax=Alphaproteobacteria TaxID=28211 RepID=UPI003263A64C
MLGAKGPLFAARLVSVSDCVSRGDVEITAGDLFDVVGNGIVKIGIHPEYHLAETPQTHKGLTGRETIGTTILTP